MVRRLPKRVIQKISQNRRTITTIDHRIRSGFSFTGTDYLALTKKEAVPYQKISFPVHQASMRGFEPPTYRLGGGRSIRLSYMDMMKIT